MAPGTWQPDWASDPQLKSAGLVIGPVKAPLTQMLRMDPHYKLVYEDKLASSLRAHANRLARHQTYRFENACSHRAPA